MIGSYSEHFSSSELACHHCGKNECTPELVSALEQFREQTVSYCMRHGYHFLGVHVDDAYRCPEHNRQVGGVPDSQHVLGKAADVSVHGLTGVELYQIALTCPLIQGIGRDDHKNYIHLDVRAQAAKWCYDLHGKEMKWYDPPGTLAA